MPQKLAQINLQHSLYHLRRAVPKIPGPGPAPFLLADRKTVQINPEYPIALDVAWLSQWLNGPHECWVQAVELYRGELLADCDLPILRRRNGFGSAAEREGACGDDRPLTELARR